MSFLSSLFTRAVPREVEAIKTLGSDMAGAIDKAFERSLLDKCASAIDGILADAKAEMATLKAEIFDRETQIDDRQEKVRHASVVLDAFGAAKQRLEAGYDQKQDAPAADPAPADPAPADPAPAGLEPVLLP